MAFDRFKGQAQQAAGSVQSAVGDMTGDEGMQAKGMARDSASTTLIRAFSTRTRLNALFST